MKELTVRLLYSLMPLLSLSYLCAMGCAGGVEEAASVETTTAPTPPVLVDDPAPPSPLPDVTPLTLEQQLQPFSGRYQIARSLEHDGCGGRIVGRAQTLVVDAGQGFVHADNVNRIYHARVDGGLLIAENRFEETFCPESTHFARWTLRRTDDGSLDGTVESQWLLPPCLSPCVIRFRIRASPIR